MRLRFGERPKCKLVDCDSSARALGLCEMHYQRFKKHGSTDLPEFKANGRPVAITDFERGAKLCSGCDQWKPLGEYRKIPSRGGGGWAARCNICERAYQRDRNHNLSAEQRESHAAARERWREANKDYLRTWERNRRATRKGITPDEWLGRVEAQHGACAICGDEPDDPLTLHIDHDHATGTVRGLLCNRCNTALGMLRDDPMLMACAIEYLQLAREGVRPGVPLVWLRFGNGQPVAC